jgi:CheY-like chemotaxis protein
LPQETENQKAMVAGADAYIMKPFSPAALVKELAEILASRPDHAGPT